MIFTAIYIGILVTLTTFAVKFDCPGIVMTKIRKWNKLTTLVKSRHKNTAVIVWVSIKMLCTALYISLIQYMNKSVKKLSPNLYEVSYVINGSLYKIIVTSKKGPPSVLQISNDEEEDVTDIVIPFMGPNYDWHSSTFDPSFFGYKTLTFELADGTELTFSDTIIIYNTKKI